MNTEKLYDEWAVQYDHNINLTRDVEAKALREMLEPLAFDSCLEIGCGTGKNTVWLVKKVKEMVSVDFSGEMLVQAKEKIKEEKVHFVKADIKEDWTFNDRTYDLVSFSLVLEHIENLEAVFEKTNKALKPGGYVFIGELHPYKQYTGSKARFENEDGLQILNCYTHNISDFTNAAKKTDLNLVNFDEYFDEGNRQSVPRILSLLFQKPIPVKSS